MINSKYIKDTRIATGDFYITKKVRDRKYEVIYKYGEWHFQIGTIVDIDWIKQTNAGIYKNKLISKKEAFLEMI
jgi:hypothetical protein